MDTVLVRFFLFRRLITVLCVPMVRLRPEYFQHSEGSEFGRNPGGGRMPVDEEDGPSNKKTIT